ncbi:hypothetical protein TIFTF001_015361 [Ficus carica]|uniref:Uncharacterized protein n=1 Tax=Ficus carica TaxID=3494 RepID=A0AA88D525_FICCA|nr:hypothetical protein TIFTF001_015361 [Ficus carica]
MHHYQLAIPQLMPNGMKVFLGLIVIADEAGVELSVDNVLALYYPQENSKDHGRYSMYPRRKKQVVGKDLKKPPPKALLFEEKLKRLLAQPNREWDEINIPKRFRASSLWKDFVEIETGTPLFIEPLFDEEALIVELALDTMNIEFPSLKELLARKKAQKEAAKAAAAEKTAQAGRASEPPPFLLLNLLRNFQLCLLSPLPRKGRWAKNPRRRFRQKGRRPQRPPPSKRMSKVAAPFKGSRA